jgi:hypothetical protein
VAVFEIHFRIILIQKIQICAIIILIWNLQRKILIILILMILFLFSKSTKHLFSFTFFDSMSWGQISVKTKTT